MHSYQGIIDDYRKIRDSVKFESINMQRDSNVYQQYMVMNHTGQTTGQSVYTNDVNNIGSIFQNFFGMAPTMNYSMGSFGPLQGDISFSYGTIPLSTSTSMFTPLNLFDAVTQMMNQMPNQEDVKLVLKKHELDKLPKLTFEQLKQQIPTLTADDVCPLCLEKYNSSIKCSILPCKHHFCYPCIYTELSQYRHVCPLCKNNVGEYEPKI